MRTCLTAATLLLAMADSPALARPQQDAARSAAERPITDRDVSAADVVTTPLSDLNLRKGEIPPLLIAAQARPYDLAGLKRCAQITGAVAELDALLGDDLDLPGEDGNQVTAGRVAKAAVASFIPFRGLIREVSGANAQERRLEQAITAGMARRSFLKGVGQARGCRYPARPAGPATIATLMAQREAARAKADAAPRGETAKQR